MNGPDRNVAGSASDPALTLACRGYNVSEQTTLESIRDIEARRQYLKRSLETTVNHVYEDSAVSFTNHYTIGPDGNVLTHPDAIPLSIDPDERGGLYTRGITEAVTAALQNPYEVVLLYSPPGPVVFDSNPANKFRFVAPYTQGQLYFMYADGEKVHNTAISTSPEGEDWIEELMPETFRSAPPTTSQIERISYFITQPAHLPQLVDDFFTKEYKEGLVFTNKDGCLFYVTDILSQLRQSIAQELPAASIVGRILERIDLVNISEDDIHNMYSDLARLYMAERGIDSLKLGGSCGGETISMKELLGHTGSLSSDMRSLVQAPRPTNIADTSARVHFEHKPGHNCKVCGADGRSYELGDCDICRACQERFDSGELQ